MTGDDLIFLASHLTTNSAFGNAECRYRSAISRAYYGAYHLIVSFLKELAAEKELAGVNLRVPENHDGHQEAYRLLFATAVPEAVEAARHLNDLRGERNNADYKLSRRGYDSMANAKEKVEMAISVQSLIRQCSTREKIKEFIAAITSSK